MSEGLFKEERKRRVEDDPSLEPAYPSKRLNTSEDESRLKRSDEWRNPSSSRENKGDSDHRFLPPKKSVVEEDPDGEIPGSGVLGFQKEAIWRQMQHYKRKSVRAEQRIAQLENKQSVYDSSLALANTYMHKVFEDLKQFLLRMDDGSKSRRIQPEDERPYQSELLKEIIRPGIQSKEVEAALEHTWVLTNDILTELLRRVDYATERRTSEADSGTPGDQLGHERAKVDQLQARVHSLSEEVHTLQGELHAKQRQIVAVTDQLSETSDLLSNTERTLDRLKMSSKSASQSLSHTEEDKRRETEMEVEDVNSASFIAETRLADIQHLRAKNLSLMEELEKNRLQNANNVANDDLIRESPLYRNLDEEYKYQLKENDVLKQRLDKNSVDLNESRAERARIAEDMEAEELGRRRGLEAEMKKLESDLTRIRGHRDQLQHNLDLRVSKDEIEIQQLQEIRVVANARKDRIHCLEQDVLRLKLHMAANTGDRALITFFEENPDGNPILDLRQKLKDAQHQIRELKHKVSGQNHVPLSEDAASTDRQWEENVEERQDSLSSYKKLFGEAGSEVDAMKEFATRLEEREKELDKLRGKLEAFEKTESRLGSEIETLGKAWSELEEQNSRKVLDLAEKEDNILRLMAERTKYDQKCAMLTKQSATANNLAIALRRQSDKQLEQIRNLEQREKMLLQQLNVLERDVAAHKASFEQQQRSLADHLQEIAQLKGAERNWMSKYENATQLLKQKLALLENEMEERRKAQESLGILQRKVDKLSKTEAGPDAGLTKELEEYK
ncbi:hypothetical protein PhCBS80983_g03563 [Powellomyces hirtus]|uniref:E3 ubiquitin protein ligase n=1 Tax=Powellomyces hirtus TaxID=109895 RepID=A0A507E1T6_9FUNG|nr:hypothetical protein PhCBS80983_g03563 [Powellomyces hirtus]